MLRAALLPARLPVDLVGPRTKRKLNLQLPDLHLRELHLPSWPGSAQRAEREQLHTQQPGSP